jgi:hypothetical protein
MQSSSDTEERGILTRVRESAAKRILFLPHALNQMNSPERMISTQTTYLPNPEQWEADWRTRRKR